jgi:cell wall-associated NlpC family hydrolase
VNAALLLAQPRTLRWLLLAGAAFVLITLSPLLVLMLSLAGPPTSSSPIADIPPSFLAYYQRVASEYGIDWSVLAAIHFVECDDYAARACAAPNNAGAVGPMQFLPPTWHRPPCEVCAPVPRGDPSGGYAKDGDGDGRADIRDQYDAIAGAAALLAANGAPRDYHAALLAYNHASWYVDEVLAQAASYRRALGIGTGGGAAVVAWAERYLGTPYVWGGNHSGAAVLLDAGSTPRLEPGGDGRLGYFDCASLVAWAYAKTAHVFVGGTSTEQWARGATDPRAAQGTTRPPGGFQAGDLVFFDNAQHVGLVTAADEFIAAPHTGADIGLYRLSTYPGFFGWVRYAPRKGGGA